MDFMSNAFSVDAVIRATLREEVAGQGPAASVRDSLLATVERENERRSSLGPSIPPLVAGLQENREERLDLAQSMTTTFPIAQKYMLLLAVPLYAMR